MEQTGARQIMPGIYNIPIRLVKSPLKNLNCYIIKGNERNLLIDTGFNQPECLADLRAGLRALEIDMERTDIFVTHLHADHCGLVPRIMGKDTTVYMSAVDKAIFEESVLFRETYWEQFRARYRKEGYPAAELEKAFSSNAAKQLSAGGVFPSVPVADGDIIEAAGLPLRCLHTPGHTPGHMCLYSETGKIMFLGDHVLFDITPNITGWPEMRDPLAAYLLSLEKIKRFETALPLPAHRTAGTSLVRRADELIEHHNLRLQEMQGIVAANPGIRAYDVAARMKWSIRAKDWDDFPPPQKWFAMGETLSHLEYLTEAGRILKDKDFCYTVD